MAAANAGTSSSRTHTTTPVPASPNSGRESSFIQTRTSPRQFKHKRRGTAIAASSDQSIIATTSFSSQTLTGKPGLAERKRLLLPPYSTDAVQGLDPRIAPSTLPRENAAVPHGSTSNKDSPRVQMTEVRPDARLDARKRTRFSPRTPQNASESKSSVPTEQHGRRKVMRVRADGKLASPKSKKLEANSVNDGPQVAVAVREETKTSGTPPKKLLKIGPNGKLASPTSQGSVESSQCRRRGRPKKSTDYVRDGPVIIRYGGCEAARLAMGGKIQEILSRPSKQLRDDTKRVDSVPCLKKPPKATHPFFLAKPVSVDVPVPKSPEMGNSSHDLRGRQGGHKVATITKSPKWPAADDSAGFGRLIDDSGPRPIHNNTSMAIALRGAQHPIWPPRGMAHVRPSCTDLPEGPPKALKQPHEPLRPSSATKSKLVETNVPEMEDVLCSFSNSLRSCRSANKSITQDRVRSSSLHIPNRMIVTGEELQRMHSDKDSRATRDSHDHKDLEAEVNNGEMGQDFSLRYRRHPALSNLYGNIVRAHSAFDRFECEIHEWTQKYAPMRAQEVLQPGCEALILRDWLRSLVVNAVENNRRESGKPSNLPNAMKKSSKGLQGRKRKRAEELDGFVISSDEESNEMDELNDDIPSDCSTSHDPQNRKTEVRAREAANLSLSSADSSKCTNAVVVSGPSGCGKTAAIYATARELDFEVFEINSGSRRSGKDILDRVGDMSRNHLVNQDRSEKTGDPELFDDDSTRVSDAFRQEIETGKQATMSAFLQPTKKGGKKSAQKGKRAKQDAVADGKAKQKTQRQSVILLEEVDILFEEDRQFWTTTLELIVQSRRPIIMTCTDESLLPLKEMPLFGILRFRRPLQPVATQFLSLLACNEGHLLSEEAITALYESTCNDLRASITQLQFYCQMALGDTKGGLEWMLIASSATEKEDFKNKRVVSDGTYPKGMGFIGSHKGSPPLQPSSTDEMDTVLSLWQDWAIDLADQDDFLAAEAVSSPVADGASNLAKLESIDRTLDALSSADTLRYSQIRDASHLPLDCSTPLIPERERVNYVDGLTLLQADVVNEPLGIGDSVAAALRIFARRNYMDTVDCHQSGALDESYVAKVLPAAVEARQRSKPVTHRSLSTAFAPLAKPSSLSVLALKGPFISALYSPMSTISQDIAPYIRSIVSYDVCLEEQRRQLVIAASGGCEGRNRTRTTRASRAALEGGSKAHTRRERWFPNTTNFQAVLRTGGSGWPEVHSRRSGLVDNGVTGVTSRRSSLGSVESSSEGTA